MRYCSFVFFLFAFVPFGTTQESAFSGSWELAEVVDSLSEVLPKTCEQFYGKRFHFLPEWLVIEDEDGYCLVPLRIAENTAHYGNATLTLVSQTADSLQVAFLDNNYNKELILSFVPAPPLAAEVLAELLQQPTIVSQNGLNLQGFYYHFNEVNKEYTYFRFYPDSTLTRKTSELPPGQMIPLLNQAAERRENVTFSLSGEREQKGTIAHFSAPPQMEFTDLSRIVYQDFILLPQQDSSIIVTKVTHYNVIDEPGGSEQFTLTFYPAKELSFRQIAAPGKRYQINFSNLAGMSSLGESPYYLTTEAPRFPGCEELTDSEERQNCAQKALMAFIYRRLKYPESAINKGIEGTTVVAFTVQPDGSVTDIKLLRGIGPGCDQEALRTIAKMHHENIRWVPGKRDGIPVAVPFTIPITFKLQ